MRACAFACSNATRPNRMLSWIDSAWLTRSAWKNSQTSSRPLKRRLNSARAARMRRGIDSSITPTRCRAFTSRSVSASRRALSASAIAAMPRRPISETSAWNSGRSSGLMKLYCAKSSLSGATSANNSTISSATFAPAAYSSSSRPTSRSNATTCGFAAIAAGWKSGCRGMPNKMFSAMLMLAK